jgi:predicted enzyme related to lactoylglutathione lyase
VESTSRDSQGAKAFYGGIFDWSFDDSPLLGGTPYSRAMVGTRSVCGFYQVEVPSPFWLSYIAVDDADAAAKRAAQLNGKIVKDTTDAGPGRFAIIEDPTGGTFAVWQPTQSLGSWLYGENNALCWNELVTSDVEKARAFYTGLFGWKAESMQMGNGPYTLFKSGVTQVGGMTVLSKQMKGTPTHWSVYFQVPKADETLARAQKNGASVLMPMTTTEGVGKWALLRDVQGAAFGVLQPMRKPSGR